MRPALARMQRWTPIILVLSLCLVLGTATPPVPLANAAVGLVPATGVPAKALERDRLRGQQSVNVPPVTPRRPALNRAATGLRGASTTVPIPASLVGLALADLTVGPGSTLEKAQQSGAGWMLGWISWQNLEPVEGQFAWASGTGNDIDNLIRASQWANLSALARLQNVPAWATTDGSTNLSAVRAGALMAFGQALATHTAGRVPAFEIFNEPNLNYEWGVTSVDASGPVGYAQLLRSAYVGIKAGDPSAIVVSAGLADGAGGQSMDDLVYLAGLYAAGARRGTHFDAVGTHPYGGSYPPEQDPSCGGTCLRHAELQHQIMLNNGDAATPMWATEVGWLLDDPNDLGIFFNWMKVSAQQQADYVTGAMQYAHANWPWMQHLFVFNLDHSTAMWCGGACYPPTTSVTWFSILNADRTPRLAYTELQTLLHQAPPTLTPTATLTATPTATPTTTVSGTPTMTPTLAPTSSTPTGRQPIQDVTLGAPQRLVDTRVLGQPVPAGQSHCFTVAGQGSIPSAAAGVILNVTAVGYTDFGWLTLYPAGQSMPATSTLNFDTHDYAIANGAVVRLGTGGQVCVSASRSASHVILDATGYLPGTSSELQLLPQPWRAVDTRTSGGPLAAGSSRCFSIAGQAGIPANAVAALVNLTAVGYPTHGWLTLYPEGQGVPSTSSVNFDTSAYAIANWAVMGLGATGQLCVNAGISSSDVVIDVTGYLASGGVGQISMLASPQRVLDTRLMGHPIGAGQAQCSTLAGQSGIPPDAVGVILNVTAVGYVDFGWLTLYPDGQTLPSTSTLNFDTPEYAIANGAVVMLGSHGDVCVNAGRSGSHVLLDVVGYISR